MKMMNDLIKSYKNTISTMDLRTVKPFTETEIQPIYAERWIKTMVQTIDSCKAKKLSKKEILECFPNVSMVRSMLIMDIYALYYSKADKETIRKVVNFYIELLDIGYDEDKFSLKVNKPIHMKQRIKDNASYYISNTLPKEQFTELGVYCFYLAFELVQDIFADNCYEVMGPFYEQDKIFIVKEFHNIPSDEFTNIRIIEVHNKEEEGTIDLFAHSTFERKDCEIFLEVDGKEYVGDITPILEEIKIIFTIARRNNKKETETEQRKRHLENRWYRYEKLTRRLGGSTDLVTGALMFAELAISPLQYRECNTSILADIIKDTLEKGGYND